MLSDVQNLAVVFIAEDFIAVLAVLIVLLVLIVFVLVLILVLLILVVIQNNHPSFSKYFLYLPIKYSFKKYLNLS